MEGLISSLRQQILAECTDSPQIHSIFERIASAVLECASEQQLTNHTLRSTNNQLNQQIDDLTAELSGLRAFISFSGNDIPTATTPTATLSQPQPTSSSINQSSGPALDLGDMMSMLRLEMQGHKFCDNCSTQNAKDALVCTDCQAQLPEETFEPIQLNTEKSEAKKMNALRASVEEGNKATNAADAEALLLATRNAPKRTTIVGRPTSFPPPSTTLHSMTNSTPPSALLTTTTSTTSTTTTTTTPPVRDGLAMMGSLFSSQFSSQASSSTMNITGNTNINTNINTKTNTNTSFNLTRGNTTTEEDEDNDIDNLLGSSVYGGAIAIRTPTKVKEQIQTLTEPEAVEDTATFKQIQLMLKEDNNRTSQTEEQKPSMAIDLLQGMMNDR